MNELLQSLIIVAVCSAGVGLFLGYLIGRLMSASKYSLDLIDALEAERDNDEDSDNWGDDHFPVAPRPPTTPTPPYVCLPNDNRPTDFKQLLPRNDNQN